MNTQETFSPENRGHIDHSAERMFQENMLQMGWFDHRYDSLSNEELQDFLEKVHAAAAEEQKARIEKASPAERKEIVLEEMILSPSGAGSVERAWFREIFLKLPESAELLRRFPDEPETVLKEMDALFMKSHH